MYVCTCLVSNFVAILQTSGSLYGALIGSVLAFNVSDFLGLFSNIVRLI